MIPRLHVPLIKPEDVIPHLAKKEKDWEPGCSACELATSWCNARNDFPKAVRAVLKTAPEYANAELIDGFFERKVDLRSRGRDSQTDLMVIAGLGEEIAVIAVEGKVEEPFDKLITKWNDTPGKEHRLRVLCKTLGLDASRVGCLRYQLLHRVAGTIYEAQRYRCKHALTLVHSFSRPCSGFGDFSNLCHALGLPVKQTNVCSIAKKFEGVSLRLGWVSDTLSGNY